MHALLQRGTLLKYAAVPLLAALLWSAANVGQVAENTPPTTTPRITAPVLLQFDGQFGWATEPPEAKARFVEVEIPTVGRCYHLVWPNHPRVVVLLLGDRVVLDRYVIPEEGLTPDPIPPDPVPTPDPIPPDPVPTPQTIREVMIVCETDSNLPGGRTAQQAAVMLSLEWQQAARKAGAISGIRDRNLLSQRLQPLEAKAADGPVVCFIGDDVAEAVCVPMPDTAEGLVELVKEKLK